MKNCILQFVFENRASVVLALGVLGTAFASTYPENRPKTLDDFWAWSRDFVHQLANARRPTMPKP